MAADLRLAAEAAQDIAEAHEWYEGRRRGLGTEFVNQLDACLQGTLRSPRIHPVVRGSYRRALLRRFPYAVFYEFQDEVVTVYCVFHTARDPAGWHRRLP